MRKTLAVVTKLIIIPCILLVLAGCVGMPKGSLSQPLSLNTESNFTGKETATVHLYRSTGFFGALDISDVYVNIDEEIEGFSDNDKSKIMIANRSSYYLSEISPGVHSFTLAGFADVGRQIVNLLPGENYYLAVTFGAFGSKGLEFRNKADFLKETKNQKRIEAVGEWSSWDGFETRVVK